jgi:hypothetical protein
MDDCRLTKKLSAFSDQLSAIRKKVDLTGNSGLTAESLL